MLIKKKDPKLTTDNALSVFFFFHISGFNICSRRERHATRSARRNCFLD